MNGSNCDLCLCCGAPWPPVKGDVLDAETLGNLSINHLNKKYMEDEHMRAKFKAPKFGAPKQASHLLHESHHRWAVQFMAVHRSAGQLVGHARPSDDDGAFPFLLNPKSKAEPRLAWWAPIQAEDRLDHKKLLAVVAAVSDDRPHRIEWDLTAPTCRSCNNVMTMEFWFRFHLYGTVDKNETRLIDGGPISLYSVNIHGHKDLVDYNFWTVGGRLAHDWPRIAFRKTEDDIMSAAVAYYINMCMPTDWPVNMQDAVGPNRRILYLYLCWIVLEVTCLVCEYTRGNRDDKNHRLLQAPKSHLGAIELYTSFYAYTLLSYERPDLRDVLGFEQWHQQYFWFGWRCGALFDDPDAERRLWAFKVIPPASDGMGSRELVETVSNNMYALLDPLRRLATHLLGEEEVPRGIREYFLPVAQLGPTLQLINNGTVPDFDTFVCQVGIDCMLQRVVDLSCDASVPMRKILGSFLHHWRSYEVDNMLRHSHSSEKDRDVAKIVYQFCKLAAPPETIPGAKVPLSLALGGAKRCPWACARLLHQLRAFDFGEVVRKQRGRRAIQ